MARLLDPVLDYMAWNSEHGVAFDIGSFWGRIVQGEGEGTARPYISRWITAFLCIRADDNVQHFAENIMEFSTFTCHSEFPTQWLMVIKVS
jgi:hypothetical protein